MMAGRGDRGATRWLSWLLGAAMLGAVVAVALRFAEARDFVRIAERAEPWWLVVAVGLQAATYLAEARIWQMVGHAVHFALPLPTAYGVSLTKLFVDQALPSGGISGMIVVARSLGQRGMPRPAVMAAIVVSAASHYATYVACLAVAVCIVVARGQASGPVALVSLVFALFGIVVVVMILALSGRGVAGPASRLRLLHPLREALRFLEDADPRLARDPRLLLGAAACRLTIFLLDAATMWVLIRALGAYAAPASVFAALVIATVFRTVGFLPGGLGTFEAASVLMLKMIGLDVAVGLSSTLLFRGLSFWVPMLPGMWIAHRAVTRR